MQGMRFDRLSLDGRGLIFDWWKKGGREKGSNDDALPEPETIVRAGTLGPPGARQGPGRASAGGGALGEGKVQGDFSAPVREAPGAQGSSPCVTPLPRSG